MSKQNNSIVEHDENRERELQLLCSMIMSEEAEYESNPNGPDNWRCPYCWAVLPVIDYQNVKRPKMEEFDHEHDCIWSIAKGLYTGRLSNSSKEAEG